MNPTCEQIANSYHLWGEQIDPDDTMTEAEFEALTVEARLALIHQTFPGECSCEIDAVQYGVYDAETNAMLDGEPDKGLIEASKEWDTGKVLAHFDGLQWVHVPGYDEQRMADLGYTIRTVYVAE